MKKTIAITLFIYFSLSSVCQHTQIDFSDDFKIAEKEYRDQTISHSVYHNNSFYTVTNSKIGGGKWLFTKLYDVKFDVTVSRFDRNMNKIKETELDNGSKSFGPLFPELFLLDNKLYLAYFQSDNKSSFNLYLALIDNDKLTTANPKKICTIQQENVGIFKLTSVIEGGLIYLCNSTDNKQLLVVAKTSQTTLQTFIIDADLNIVKQSSPLNAGAEFQISSAVLTKENLACLILESDKENKIAYISPDGKKGQIVLKPSGSLRPYFTRANLSHDGRTIYMFSSCSADNEDCNGLLISQLDCTTLKLSEPLAYQFSPEFIETISRKGGGSKRKKEYYMFNFVPQLIELDNANIAIIGSPASMTSRTSTSAPNMNNQTSTIATTTLNVGPIIAFLLDKSGKSFEHILMPRKIVISKSQRSGSGAIQLVQAPGLSSSSSSFIAANSNNEIIILYNDNEANLKNSDSEKVTTSYSTSNLVMAEALIKDKKLNYRKQIGENLKGDYTYYLGNAVPNSSSSVIFPIGKGGVGFNALKTFFSNWCFIDIR